jgi:hypothetical protein
MSCAGTFPRTQFLGATISQYQASLGWNGQQGELSAIVINDDCNGGGIVYADNGNGIAGIATSDAFNPPELGKPVTFRYSGFKFSGILRNWKEDDSASGPKQYNISVVDPKDIIDGTQIILNNYIGETFELPNLVNVFGFLEDVLGASCPEATLSWYPPFGFNIVMRYLFAGGYGGADDRGGLPWGQIRYALTSLLNVPPGVSSFGSACQYRGQNYFVDLTDLPYLDDWVRFSSDSMSLGSLIHEVCELTSHDYFYTLVNHNTIKVNVVNRSDQAEDYSAFNVDQAVGSNIDDRLNLGTISSTVGSATGVTQKSRGVELRPAVTNSFITGEYRQDIWQTALMLADSGSTIWPYWGKDIYDNYIVGHGVAYENNPIATEHYFDVDMSGWGIPGLTGAWRVTTTELRFALEGETVWRDFVLARQPGLAAAIGLVVEDELPHIGTEHFRMLMAGANRPQHLQASSLMQAQLANYEGEIWDRFSRMYDQVLQYANNYFGKKYVVRLPYLCIKLDSNTPYTLQTNWQIAQDGGWFEGAVLGLMPGSILLENFRHDDGKIDAFVGYQTSGPLDLSGITNSENFIQTNPYTAYVKCQVNDLIQFGPGDWRAVIEVPGLVRVAQPHPYLQQMLGIWAMMRARYGVNYVPDWSLFEIGKEPGADKIQYQLKPLPQIPLAAAIPLQSNRLVYGPWGAKVGSLDTVEPSNVGTTSYERNSEFAPWNFGSVTRMNTAGDALAISRLSNHYVVEQGVVTIADAPIVELGKALFAGGPLVTRMEIRVSGDQSAITTNYNMKTYTPDYGKLGRQFVNAVKRNGQWARKANRIFRRWALEKQRKTNDLLATLWAGRLKNNIRYNTGSSHDLLVGRSIYDPVDEDTVQSVVVNTELRKALPQLNAARPSVYRMTAAMDGIGLLRAFSTNEGDKWFAGLPAFENAGSLDGECTDSDAQTHSLYYSREQVPPVCAEPHIPITMETLNPFLKDGQSVNDFKLGESLGHDIEYIARDGVYPADLSVRVGGYSEDNWYRGICFKGPMIMAGWGFDTDNNPVPNRGGDGGQVQAFEDNWLRKPYTWKCGPIDLRWDNRRKVWTAPSPIKLVRVLIQGPSLPGWWTYGYIQDDPVQPDCNGSSLLYGNIIPVYNSYCRPFPPGTTVYCHWDTTTEKYYVVHGDDPLYLATTLSNMSSGGSATAIINSALGCSSSIAGKRAFVTSQLKQPMCSGSQFFGYLYQWVPTSYVNVCGYPCVSDAMYYLQPVQAKFGNYLVVTCIDFIECDVSVNHTLSHVCDVDCSSTPYGSCYCDCTCTVDSHSYDDEWKEYKLAVHARKFYVQAPPTNEATITLPDGNSCSLSPSGINCFDQHKTAEDLECSPGGGGG